VPGVEELTDRVDVLVPPEETETLPGLSERLRPVGELVEDRATVPAKLFRLVRDIVELEVDPMAALSVVGLGEIVKSGEGDVGLKNSVIAVALPSPVLRLAKFQLTSTVFGKE
jgi:hypothetical protein